jgi:hypothetical protein
MNVKIKNVPRLALSNLLRRRKMSLHQFLTESGIHAYVALVNKCNEIGVQPPSEAEYHAVVPKTVSSPQDGIVVLEPIPVVDDLTGRRIDPDAPVTLPGVEVVTDPAPGVEAPTVGQQKRRRKQKVEPQES